MELRNFIQNGRSELTDELFLRGMAFMDTTDVVCHRLKDYKRTSKETEDVKSTRKLLAGIKLRRDRRENEV